MDDLRERIAYLQGLAEGLKFEEGKEETRVIKQLIDILSDLIDRVEEIQASQEDLEDYLESIDEDLYGDDEDVEEDDEEIEDESDEDGPEIEGDEDDELGSVSEEEFNYVEVECKNCHDIICFEEELLHDDDLTEIACPNCNQVVFVNDGSTQPPQGSGKAKGPPAAGPEAEDI